MQYTIAYRKEDGRLTVRTITPLSFKKSNAGNWIMKVRDKATQEIRTLRFDRFISHNPNEIVASCMLEMETQLENAILDATVDLLLVAFLL